MSYELKINKEFEGTKAKNYLKKTIDVPHSALFKYLKNKRITLNGKKIKKDDVLRGGDIIKVWLDTIPLKETKKNFNKSKNLGMEVIGENEDFLVLNKLPGIVVQGAQEQSESLSLHLAYLKQKAQDFSDFEYFHVHRLDKQTSGVLVIAKTRTALRELNALFKSNKVEKTYVCLCDGEFEQTEGTIEVHLQRNPEGSKEKVSVVDTKTSQSKTTVSHYAVLEQYSYGEDVFSLVRVTIETGFMHQIRVHMKYLGHPIIGDSMYGNSYLNRKYSWGITRQFLHAKTISFTYKDEFFSIEAPINKDLVEFLSYIKKK